MRKSEKKKPTPIVQAPPVAHGKTSKPAIYRDCQLITTNVSAYERNFLAVCQQIYRNDHGSFTPFEKFFGALASLAELRGIVSPEDMRVSMQEFRDDFDGTVVDPRDFKRNGAELLTAQAASEAPNAA